MNAQQFTVTKFKTYLCARRDHLHADPHQDVIYATVGEHQLMIETERNSGLYTLWIDGAKEPLPEHSLISISKLNRLIQALIPEEKTYGTRESHLIEAQATPRERDS